MHQEQGLALAVELSTFNLEMYRVEPYGSETDCIAPISAWVLNLLGGVVGETLVTLISAPRTEPDLTTMQAILNLLSDVSASLDAAAKKDLSLEDTLDIGS
jgi:hypothetical protein